MVFTKSAHFIMNPTLAPTKISNNFKIRLHCVNDVLVICYSFYIVVDQSNGGRTRRGQEDAGVNDRVVSIIAGFQLPHVSVDFIQNCWVGWDGA